MKGIDRKSCNEIVREMEEHIQEVPETETPLLEKSGTPAELTGKYLGSAGPHALSDERFFVCLLSGDGRPGRHP